MALDLKDIDITTLDWVHRGCDLSHPAASSFRVHASALSTQGLLIITARQPWQASLTEEGAAVLAANEERVQAYTPRKRTEAKPVPQRKGVARSGNTKRPSAPSPKRTPQRPLQSAPDLLPILRIHGGFLELIDMPLEEAAQWRLAVTTLRQSGRLPKGSKLHSRGWRTNTVTIWVDGPLEETPSDSSKQPLGLPEHIDDPHPLVKKQIIKAQQQGHVPSKLLRTVHLLASALSHAGLHPRGQSDRFFVISPDEFEVHFLITAVQEARGEQVTVHVTSLHQSERFVSTSRAEAWQQVGRIIAFTRQCIGAERRIVAEEQRRQAEAHNALAEAQARVVTNRSRADEQIALWRKAKDLREYADAVRRRATSMENSEDMQEALRWAGWMRAEADRIDPLTNVAQLRCQP